MTCLNLPPEVQSSYAAKHLAGTSPIVRSTCIKTVNVLVAKLRGEMAAATPYMHTKHLAAKRSTANRQNTGAVSEFTGNGSAGRNAPGDFQVHSEPILLDNVSQTAETAWLVSPEHQSAITELAYPEMPQLSQEEVEEELHAIDQTAVRKRVIPLEELQRRHKVKRTSKQPAINPPARVAVAIHPVPTDYGSAARDSQAAHRRVTSSSPATTVVKSNQPVATVMQREPESSATASRHTTSPAARRGSPAPKERRGSPKPRSTSRSYTRSRSPVRNRRGGPGRAPIWLNRPRSPERGEWRSTLRPSPGRPAPQDRGKIGRASCRERV